MDAARNIAPIKLELLFAIVHNSKQAYYSSLIQSHQANLQLTVPSKGTTHLILNYLGLTEKPQSLLMCVVRADESAATISLLREQFLRGGDYKGIAFTIPFSSMIGTLSYGFLSNFKQVKEDNYGR